MLRKIRLRPGQRALLPQFLTQANNATRTIATQPIKFDTRRSTYAPFTFLGRGEAVLRPSSSSPRPPSRWSPSSISTIALGSILAGSWYIIHEGRSYKVAAEVDKYEPRVLGRHREGKVNADYVSYDHWVESRRVGQHGRHGSAHAPGHEQLRGNVGSGGA
ncbi:hypothetical protein VTI74DRAFT_9426 [Chaetomium olivicolor]